MKPSARKQLLFGSLGFCAGGLALSFGYQAIIGIYAFFILDYSEYEQGRVGLLLLVALLIFLVTAFIAFWTLRKCFRLQKVR